MKTRQLASVIHYGEYKVIYDYTKETNPFRIYRIRYEGGRKKKRLCNEYADYASCMYYLAGIIQKDNWHMLTNTTEDTPEEIMEVIEMERERALDEEETTDAYGYNTF